MRMFCVAIFSMLASLLQAQNFYFGTDLSYLNEMEDCGASYKEDGVAKDPYQIMKDHVANLVRLRLWHTPSWYDDLNNGNRYSDLNDVRLSIARAKAIDMDVLLNFHLSDTWADPTHQVAPLAWTEVLDDLPALVDSVYNYFYATLENLAQDDLIPEIVQIGNETNKGILLSQEVNDSGWVMDWNRNSQLFNAAIDAINDFEVAYGADIKIALHIANPSEALWYIQQFQNHSVDNFDIIGISYYYQWHPLLFSNVGSTISSLRTTFQKDVMIFETAYPWTTTNADAANNILSTTYPGYTPLSPANQKKWMIDLTQEVIDNGGKGVIYWEPGWVSTSCETQWVTGSSWDNATFFDADHELIEAGGIGWMSHPYDFVLSTKDDSQEENNAMIINGNYLNLSIDKNNFRDPLVMYNILSIDGKELAADRVNLEEGIEFDFSGYPAGVYVLSLLLQSGRRENYRFVKS